MNNPEYSKEELNLREYVRDHYPLLPKELAKLVSEEAETFEKLHVELVRVRPYTMKSKLHESQQMLKNDGYKGIPSLLRVRTEFLRQLTLSWRDFAKEGFDRGDFACYVLYGDIAYGASIVACALIEADALITQQLKKAKRRKSIMSLKDLERGDYDQALNTVDDCGVTKYVSVKKCAIQLRTQSSSVKATQDIINGLQQGYQENSIMTPHYGELVVKGAQIGAKILDELGIVQKLRV